MFKSEEATAGIEWETLTEEVLHLISTGQYDRGVLVAKKALEVAEKNGGPDLPNVTASLNNLARLYQAQGQYAQAEPLYKRAGDQGKSPRIRPSRCGDKPQESGSALRRDQPYR